MGYLKLSFKQVVVSRFGHIRLVEAQLVRYEHILYQNINIAKASGVVLPMLPHTLLTTPSLRGIRECSSELAHIARATPPHLILALWRSLMQMFANLLLIVLVLMSLTQLGGRPNSLSISSLDGHTPAQKKLSDAIEEMQFNSLLNSCSDKARLLSVSSPNAAVWISVVPSLSLGLHLDLNEFQTAVKWWLGVNPSLNLDGNPMVCPLCPNALDPLGYHCVTCKRGVDITTRHNTLRNVVYSTFQQAGLPAHLEVGCGWGQDNSRTQSEDILVTNWDCGTSAAFDITVASPLNSIIMLEAGMHQGVLAKVAEHRKHTENDPKCVELSWRCIQLAVESYGAWGPEALRVFSQVATRLALRGNTPKSKVAAELYGRLSLLLVRANPRSILVHSYPQTPQQEDELFT
eukprot:Em0022g609a